MSDRSGRKPKGTMVRPAPDWFSDNLAVIGGQFVEINPPAGLHYQTWAIYNNSNPPRVFKVYGFTASNGGGGGLAMWYLKGTIGNLQYAASTLRAGEAQPPGLLYFRQFDVPAGTLNSDIPSQILGVMGAAFDTITTVSPFPLFIIPFGYSLVGSTPQSCLGAGITAWYQVANN